MTVWLSLFAENGIVKNILTWKRIRFGVTIGSNKTECHQQLKYIFTVDTVELHKIIRIWKWEDYKEAPIDLSGFYTTNIFALYFGLCNKFDRVWVGNVERLYNVQCIVWFKKNHEIYCSNGIILCRLVDMLCSILWCCLQRS